MSPVWGAEQKKIAAAEIANLVKTNMAYFNNHPDLSAWKGHGHLVRFLKSLLLPLLKEHNAVWPGDDASAATTPMPTPKKSSTASPVKSPTKPPAKKATAKEPGEAAPKPKVPSLSNGHDKNEDVEML